MGNKVKSRDEVKLFFNMTALDTRYYEFIKWLFYPEQKRSIKGYEYKGVYESTIDQFYEENGV